MPFDLSEKKIFDIRNLFSDRGLGGHHSPSVWNYDIRRETFLTRTIQFKLKNFWTCYFDDAIENENAERNYR